jgi:4-hydroxythreonine-4-phosphate dehydrogenase
MADIRLLSVESDLSGLVPAAPSAVGGQASVRYIRAAVDAVRHGLADAIVTGPISKHAIRLAGYPWPGHTELLAEAFGAHEVAMMFAGGPLRVVLVTIHVALAEAIRTLSADRIVTTCRLAEDTLRRCFGLPEPRLGVCGLNPHAGEEGRFGSEEREIIGPALARLRDDGIRAEGPLPPDTAFHQALAGRFDIVVAMYHDQGLIAVKTVAFEESVNVTLGLPVVRTSVDHGTAYDIAGRGEADPRSMMAAIRLATGMVVQGKEA